MSRLLRLLVGLGIALAAILIALAVIGLLLPKGFEIERSILVDAPVERIHPYVADLRNWEKWSVWRQQDPGMQLRIGDHAEGVDASFSWQGVEDPANSGRLVLTGSDPATGIAYDLFMPPDERVGAGSIRYQEMVDGTRVTWRLQGELDAPVLGGYMALLMDGMLGGMFQDGLELLRDAVRERR